MGWDGGDSVELQMEIEDEFSISIPDDDAENFDTVASVVHYVAAKTGAGARAAKNADAT